MAKQRHKYDVYLVGTGSGCYAENYYREFIGTTTAVSEKQACNNVRNRVMRDKNNPNGGWSSWWMGDRLDEGAVRFSYEAVQIEDTKRETTSFADGEQMNMF